MGGVEKKSHSLVPGFAAARAALRASPGSRLVELYGEVFDPKTVKRFRGPEGDAAFEPMIQKRLVFVDRSNRGRQPYDWIASAIGQTPLGRELLATTWCGRYRYFRFHQSTPMSEPAIVEGSLVIEAGGQEIRLEHRSEDWGGDRPEPEHTGWVFRKDGRLFMLAMKNGVMRLAVADASSDEPKTVVTRALVVSIRTRQRDPYAARSIIVSEEDVANLERFRAGGDPQARIEAFNREIAPHQMKFMTL